MWNGDEWNGEKAGGNRVEGSTLGGGALVGALAGVRTLAARWDAKIIESFCKQQTTKRRR